MWKFLAGLGEFKIRDLNDEINKLLREKLAWEERILEIGGPDYKVKRKINKNNKMEECFSDFRKLVQKCWIKKEKKCQETKDTSKSFKIFKSFLN